MESEEDDSDYEEDDGFVAVVNQDDEYD